MLPYTLQAITTDHPLYPQVYDLREEVLRKPIGLSLRNEDLSGEAKETIIIALDESNTVIGCVMLRPIGDKEMKLRQMAVADALQGKGVGMALVRKAEEVARAEGYETITLHARQPAVPFYEKGGYRVGGAVFSEVGIPHLFMHKHLHEAVLP
jgi:predicted GNAT family N-acyltransferase